VTALLEVRALEAGYATGRVLHGIDLDIEEGQATALLGRNGVGKTTCIHAVMGMVRPWAGSVRVEGQEMVGRPPHAHAAVGMGLVPQGWRIFRPLTVEENLRIGHRGRHARQGLWNLERVYDLFPALARRQRHRGHQLSGGEQQMLAIGRALLGNPRLLLLDEPSLGLAPQLVETITGILAGLRSEGLTVLLVEQNLSVAVEVADQIAIMQKGEIVYRAATADFRRDPQTARSLLGVEAAT
jgi:branched-chain amino acid transport system ATP-binding protein